MANPVYTFYCEECSKHHTVPGKVGEAPPLRVTCSSCYGECYRVYVAPSISYRGTGWTGAQKERSARKGK